MSCDRCAALVASDGTHGPIFPDDAVAIAEAFEFPVGTHGGDVGREGWGRCRACGDALSFTCSYGPGYVFTRRYPPLAGRGATVGDLAPLRAKVGALVALPPTGKVTIVGTWVSLDPLRVAEALSAFAAMREGASLSPTPITDAVRTTDGPDAERGYVSPRGTALWMRASWAGGIRDAVKTDLFLATADGALVCTDVMDSCTTTRIELTLRGPSAATLAPWLSSAFRVLGETAY
jgi:hypothetical protein